MLKSGPAGPLARLRAWFPEREFIMRSRGEVRFLRVSSRLQLSILGGLALAAVLWLATFAGMLAAQAGIGPSAGADLAAREARLSQSERRLNAHADDLRTLASDLARRQSALEKLVTTRFGELPPEPAGQPAGPARKLSAVLPEARGLAAAETRQIAFIDGLTRAADSRADVAATAIRHAGLDPRVVLASADDRTAMGGPLIPLFAKGVAPDPRIVRLGGSLARMDALERGLAGIPSHLPARFDYISSGFGYRTDPFTGALALHPGLDFRGPRGAPIFAAARGVVSFAGVRSGYGNCVEVNHGNGLVTRYAHMSAIRAHLGQQVDAGSVLGAIGSTGRSTGPHLHFEVRRNGQAIDPRPFLADATRNA